MNLFKKATATIALVTLVSGIFSAGAYASSSTEIEAANALAAQDIIVDHSDDTAAYNLNQNVLRQEIAAVARGVANLDKKTTCDNSFSDVSATKPNNWACYSVEALLDAGLVAANPTFRPEAQITKAEAVGMMVKAAFGDEYSFDSTLGTSWQEQVVEFAVSKAIVANFTNYDTPATRGFVFEVGNESIIAYEGAVDTCDEVSQLLGLCDDEDDTTNTGSTDTGVVISGDNYLSAELSPENPAWMDLPNLASGVKVLKFDLVAGSEDVKVNSLTFESTGFGSAAVSEIAAYSDNGRISKSNDFNSDDLSELTFTDLVVQAGTSYTVTVLANTSESEWEFAIKLNSVKSDSNVKMGTIISNKFDVKDTKAVELEVTDEWVNANINSGEKKADLAEFKLSNQGSDDTNADVNVTVSSITLREVGSVDQEAVLSNITLSMWGKDLATVESMNDKYVTFNFLPFVIADGKSETLKVTADVNGGAGEQIQFKVDDAMDIQAIASKFNAVNVVLTDATFDAVSVDAGELTIYSVDATSDEIRADKDDVVLWELKVVNNSGKSLELQDLAINLELTTTSWSGFDTLGEVFENVELVVNGSSEDLDATNAVSTSTKYSQDDMGITLPTGTTILTIRADTKKDVPANVSVEMRLIDTDTDLVVEETLDDEQVKDITPSSLTWDELTFVSSTVTVSNVPLADVSVVKWSADLTALQFEIEAGSASSVTLDKVLANVTASGVAATNNEITAVSLYKGSVSEANLLDQVSGSKLNSSWVATFDWFEVAIAADATETFVVTVSLADNDDMTWLVIEVKLPTTELWLEDSDKDVVSANNGILSDKKISVTNAGSLAISFDSKNDANKDVKTILAGTSKWVVSYDIEATNEEIDIETVVFTLTGANVKNSISTADLKLDGLVVATATNSKIVNGTWSSTITFDNLTKFIVPTENTELELVLNTATIGFEKVGETVTDIYVESVVISDAKGKLSKENLSPITVNDNSLEFAIVPSVVTPSVAVSLNTSTTPQIQITADAGSNSEVASKSTPLTYVDTIKFSILGTTDADSSIDFTLVNIDDSTDSATWTLVGNELTFNLTGSLEVNNRSISSWSFEKFKIVITWADENDTVELTLAKDGVTYTVSSATVTTNLVSEVEFGSRNY